MAEQLVLLESNRDEFRLDEHTREIGLRGVAEARRRLAETLRAASERVDTTGTAAAA